MSVPFGVFASSVEEGLGVASGGATGEVLAKASDLNFDTEWIAAAGPTGATGPTGPTGATGATGASAPLVDAVAIEDGATKSRLGLPGVDIVGLGRLVLSGGVIQFYGPIFVEVPITVTDVAVGVVTSWVSGTVSISVVEADQDWQPIAGTAVTLAASVDCSTTGTKITTGLTTNLAAGRWLTVVLETENANGELLGFAGAPPGIPFLADAISSTDASGYWSKIGPSAVTDKWTRTKFANADRGFIQPALMKWELQ